MAPVPRSVSQAELQHLVSTVGDLDGWDFSPAAKEREPALWEYQEVVRRFLQSGDRVLDVGTGGGELFIGLADAYGAGVGVDHNPKMVATARRNLPEALRDRIEFMDMDGRDLAFEPESFDVVLTRHNQIWPEQIVTVLRPGGYFIGQEVGAHHDQGLFDAFGWGSNGEFWDRVALEEGEDPSPGIDGHAATFESLGCRVEAIGHCDPRAWFCDLESLVYMKASPLPEELDPKAHLDAFNRYLAAAAGPRGYETNEPNDLLVVQKA